MDSFEHDDSVEPRPRTGRYFLSVVPSAEDLERAASLGAEECPRRYCWWWISLSFEWGLMPSEGCTWPQSPKREHWHYKETPCRRCDASSQIDHFESRGPHIEADGIDASAWLKARQLNQEQYP